MSLIVAATLYVAGMLTVIAVLLFAVWLDGEEDD